MLHLLQRPSSPAAAHWHHPAAVPEARWLLAISGSHHSGAITPVQASPPVQRMEHCVHVVVDEHARFRCVWRRANTASACTACPGQTCSQLQGWVKEPTPLRWLLDHAAEQTPTPTCSCICRSLTSSALICSCLCSKMSACAHQATEAQVLHAMQGQPRRGRAESMPADKTSAPMHASTRT